MRKRPLYDRQTMRAAQQRGSPTTLALNWQIVGRLFRAQWKAQGGTFVHRRHRFQRV